MDHNTVLDITSNTSEHVGTSTDKYPAKKCKCGKEVVSMFTKAVQVNFGSPLTGSDMSKNIQIVQDALVKRYNKRRRV